MTSSGIPYSPTDAYHHCPLLCVTDALDEKRNTMDWINTLIRGIASAFKLQGNLQAARNVERNQT